MSASQLASALTTVNWKANVDAFIQDNTATEAIDKCNVRIATWAKQFEIIEKGNPALCFVREMQVASHHVSALMALALYKPAAGAMRTIVETALYYSYFRSHPSELATLARDSDFYVSKSDILDYHKAHTLNFVELQKRMGLLAGMNTWYSTVSAVLHGQLPGTWVTHTSLDKVKYSKPTVTLAVSTYVSGEDLLHKFFLCTVGRELWGNFSTQAKQLLISGLAGDLKTALEIDSA
jgi:hypothetical protein